MSIASGGSMATIDLVERNIRALIEVRRKYDEKRTLQQRAADFITAFFGSMWSIYLHVGLLLFCAAVKFGLVDLAMIASVEAIFLTTFVLISQNRAAALADRRNDLDLQISLLAEHEVTQLIAMVESISERLGVEVPLDTEDLKRDVRPEMVLEQMEEMDPR